MAIYDSLRKFKPFLYGARIVILSDSSALQWLFSKSQFKSPRLTRWALSIQGYGADILHIPGALNRPADTLSRYPIHDLLNMDQHDSQGAPGTFHNESSYKSPGKYPSSKLKLVTNKEDKRIITQAEFLVEGDADQLKALTLLHYTESPGYIELSDNNISVNSIRTNEPEERVHIDPILWTESEMKAAQQADAFIKYIIAYVKDPSAINRQQVDPNVKDLHQFILDNTGILYKKQTDPSAELRGEEEVIVVPFSLQKAAIQAIHNSGTAGHPGPERSCWAAHRKFWWRHMDRAIRRFADTCKSCLKFKGRPHPQVSTRRYPVPDRPWHTVSIDLVGRLPQTKDNHKFILVCGDHLTRYTAAVPLCTKSAK